MRSFMHFIILLAFVIKVNTTSNNKSESWSGKWFPEKSKSIKKDLVELFDTDKIETSDKILSIDKNNTETWKQKWFPHNPIKNDDKVKENKENSKETWKGNWFPRKFSRQNPIRIENRVQKNNETTNETWKGNWFPQDPSEIHVKKSMHINNSNEKIKETWKGDWFPLNPSEIHKEKDPENENSHEMTTESNIKNAWEGNWFPASPTVEKIHKNIASSSECEDIKENIAIDFDPDDKRHSHNYLCLDFKAKYAPSYSTYPIQRKYIIPPAYEAPSICLNETIEYEERLPTFGAHRYLSPKYGEYKYLPVQRWMHSLENGAIVMLYHPCANQMQVEKLKNAVRACLYRHVISPSNLLLPERPFALVAWGTSLEMSVVHLPVVIEFIKENALKHGPSPVYDGIKSYDAGLLAEAKLVTDESDSELCANFNL